MNTPPITMGMMMLMRELPLSLASFDLDVDDVFEEDIGVWEPASFPGGVFILPSPG